jgi:hypothetical protein
MADKIISFSLTIPTDNGFIGRSCGNPNCGKYFKIKADTSQERMFCPYCGLQFSKDELITRAQEAHFRAAAEEQVKEVYLGEIDKMFADLARKTRGNKAFQVKHRPQRYKAKPIYPHYQEHPVDSELSCGHCQTSFQVFGIFGYCPGCRSENLRIYDANFEIIKREIESSTNKQRALRHAYSDLVSTFEQVTAARAKAITQEQTNFQDLYETRKFFKKQTNKDIFARIKEAKIRQLQRVFLKRHVYEHNNGIISDRFVQKMPEDKQLLGQKAGLSLEELEAAAVTLKQVLDNVVSATTRTF